MIDCAGKVMGCVAEALMVLVVLPEAGGVMVAAGCATIAFRLALLYWKTWAAVAVLARLLMESVLVSGPYVLLMTMIVTAPSAVRDAA